MRMCSLWLSLALICCTASVQSQLCDSDSECDSEKCCTTGKCAERRIAVATKKVQTYLTYCACQVDNDCNSGEQCQHMPPIGRFCSRSDESSSVTSQPTWESSTYKPYTYNRKHCFWSSDCPGSRETCEDGQCVDNDESGGVDVFLILMVLGPVIFVVLICLGVLYSARQKARNQQVLNERMRNNMLELVRTTEHEMQTGSTTAASNSDSVPSYNPYRQAVERINSFFGTPRIGASASPAEIQPGPVAGSRSTEVEVKDDSCTPSPSVAPPPLYNNDNVPKKPPPSYDEAVRKSEMDLD